MLNFHEKIVNKIEYWWLLRNAVYAVYAVQRSMCQSDCTSSYLVYLVTCMSQHTGNTVETMNKQQNGHKDEIKNASSRSSTPLGRHFNRCGLRNYSLQILYCVKSKENETMLKWAERGEINDPRNIDLFCEFELVYSVHY